MAGWVGAAFGWSVCAGTGRAGRCSLQGTLAEVTMALPQSLDGMGDALDAKTSLLVLVWEV